ncbi:MAG TPA: hypothetical protein VEC96_17670 [Anaerolineae bacterium]|nr:hypothetical protein [Anaerolineae bacterium]
MVIVVDELLTTRRADGAVPPSAGNNDCAIACFCSAAQGNDTIIGDMNDRRQAQRQNMGLQEPILARPVRAGKPAKYQRNIT